MSNTLPYSLLETPHAVVLLDELFEKSAFHLFPWQEDQDPITRQEIQMALDNNLLIEPGIFADDPRGDEKDNIHECSRAEHIQRIAWLVKFADPAAEKPIRLDSVMSEGEVEFGVVNGNHLLAASIFMGRKEVEVIFQSGVASEIEKHPMFVTWLNKPMHSGHFGSNVLSTEQEVWAIDTREGNGKQVWFGNFQYDYPRNGRLRLKGAQSMSEVYAEQGIQRVKIGQEVTLSSFLMDCGDILSPLFQLPDVEAKLKEQLMV